MVLVIHDGEAELLPPMTRAERERVRRKRAARMEADRRRSRTRKDLYG